MVVSVSQPSLNYLSERELSLLTKVEWNRHIFCNSTILRQMFAEKNFHNLSAKAKFSSIFVRFILWMIKDLTSRKAISWKQTCLLLIVTFISSISGLFVSMSSWKNSDVIIDYRNRTLDQNGLSFKMTKNLRFVTRN